MVQSWPRGGEKKRADEQDHTEFSDWLHEQQYRKGKFKD